MWRIEAIYYPEENEMLNEKYTIVWLDVDFDLIVKRKEAEGYRNDQLSFQMALIRLKNYTNNVEIFTRQFR